MKLFDLSQREFISSRSVISLISFLITVVVLVIFFNVTYLLFSLDKMAKKELENRARLAIKLEFQVRKQTLSEYSYWDEAYDKIIVEQDPLWISNNSGQYIIEEYEYDFSVGVMNGNKQAYLTTTESAKALNFDEIFNSSLQALINTSAATNTVTKTAGGFFKLGNQVYLIVGGPLIDEELSLPREGTYIAAGRLVDPQYLSEIEHNYQLFALQLHLDEPPKEHSMPLVDPSNQLVGSLSWAPNYPSKKVLPTLFILFLTVGVISILVVRQILLKEQTNRDEYEDKLFAEATTDSLTGTTSRRYLFELGNKHFERARMSRTNFAILLLDIDHFKKINDKYGHSTGDKALNHFAQICRKQIEELGIIGRIGGEEFAIVLSDTTLSTASAIADQIRTSVEKTPFIQGEITINMTVSIGLTFLNQHTSFQRQLDDADLALYKAKANGRNQVVLSEFSPVSVTA